MQIFSLKRAAGVAALFAFALFAYARVTGIPAWPPMAAPAEAKMKIERLSIEKAGGGPPVTFDIELAQTDQEKSVGLMFRTQLSDTAGMLFPYGREQPITMWMRNTYIPLDMLFIRADGVIARIEVNAEPLAERIISSGVPAFAVLELAGGATGRLGIKAGDKVRHAIFGAGHQPK